MYATRIIFVTLLIVLLIAPVSSIVVHALGGSSRGDLLPELLKYAPNTVLLCLMVGFCAWWIGVIPACLLAVFDFPGKRWLKPALVLPLAMPIYLTAYVYGDIFEYAGVVQSLYRQWFGFGSAREYAFFDIRSFSGLTLIMSVGLAPYIYIFTSASLTRYSQNAYETARVLGLGHVGCFWHVIVPLTRPAWMAGLALVGMETIAEFAAVQHFGINTVTLGIYIHWLERYDLVMAARLALIGGMAMIILGLLESLNRRRQGYFQAMTLRHNHGLGVTRPIGWLMFGICLLPLIVGFIIPILFLLVHAIQFAAQIYSYDFLAALGNTILLAAAAASLATVLALFLALGIKAQSAIKPYLNILFVGYMLPGTIFALAIMLWLALLSDSLRQLFGFSLLLIGTPFGLLYGYLGRFLSIGHAVIRDGIEAIPRSINDAAQLYGLSPWQSFWYVRLPMLKPYIAAAALLVFVETIKELPMTLIMRPIGIDTLAVYLYQYASDENLPQAAPAALFISLVGVLPLWILYRLSQQKRR